MAGLPKITFGVGHLDTQKIEAEIQEIRELLDDPDAKSSS
jgi:hypothetical protein